MQLGMIGLGRMGGNIVRRLMKHGHSAVVYDKDSKAVAALAAEGAAGGSSLQDFVSKLERPRTAWVMLPAGKITEATIDELTKWMEAGDVIIDGGNIVLAGRRPPRQGAQGTRHSLCRRRHLGRRLGHRARLLHDDRRRQGGGRPPRPDLRSAGAGDRRYSAHRRTRRSRSRASSRATFTPARSAPDISSR